ncbi:MAG: DUF5011 domain-containing protein [Bacteroidia bacterium]
MNKINTLCFIKLLPLGLVLLIWGCKKEDTKAPLITLNGSETMVISLQGTYTEPGATVSDEGDADASLIISGYVNTNYTATYTITYIATDKEGNRSSLNRKIIVKNDAEALAGAYSIAGTLNYTDTVSVSKTLNNRIHFAKFSNHASNAFIHADVLGPTVTLPSQTAVQVGTPAADRTFTGSGSITSGGFTLNYTEAANGATSNVAVTYTKQ